MTGLIDENRNLIQKLKCKTEAEMTEEELALQLKEATLVRNLQHQLELISKVKLQKKINTKFVLKNATVLIEYLLSQVSINICSFSSNIFINYS